MKKIFLGILIMLSSTIYSQVTIEILKPSGEYTTHIDSSAQVHFEVQDSKLLIYSNGMVAAYQIDTVIVIQPSPCGGFLGCSEVVLLNERHGLLSIILWNELNLATFYYKDGLQVLNSGEGITYCTENI